MLTVYVIVRLLVNHRLLVVKLWGSHNLYMDFQLHVVGVSAPNPGVVQSQLYDHFIICFPVLGTGWAQPGGSHSGPFWKLQSDAGWVSHLDSLLTHMAGLADAGGSQDLAGAAGQISHMWPLQVTWASTQHDCWNPRARAPRKKGGRVWHFSDLASESHSDFCGDFRLSRQSQNPTQVQ